jgi:hypothetical protein
LRMKKKEGNEKKKKGAELKRKKKRSFPVVI